LKNRFQSGIQNMRVFGIFYIDVYNRPYLHGVQIIVSILKAITIG